MGSWKIFSSAIPASLSTQVVAEGNTTPFDNALFITTVGPSLLAAGTSVLTTEAPMFFKLAKANALAFIGSDGGTRGAQFEQAVRHYHATYISPLVTDEQLALTIANGF